MFDDCVRTKNSGITQATTNTTTNETKQEDQTDGKQQAKGAEEEANFFMQAFQEDYESDEYEYGIVCCTHSSVTVDYKRIGDRTSDLFKWNHQLIKDSLLLLDDCSIINIMCNLNLVNNIYEVDQRCIITTNAGTGSTNLKATLKSIILPLKEKIWFNYNGIANNIALHSVQDHFKFLYSHWFGTDRNTFVVIKPNNSKMKFTMSQKGLYYTDTSGLIGRP